MRLVEELGDHQVEDRVAQELEPLVAAPGARLVGMRGMRERRLEKALVCKAMADGGLERAPVTCLEAHGRASAIQPPPSTSSPRSKTAACPGATAATGSSKTTRAPPSGSGSTRAGAPAWR